VFTLRFDMRAPACGAPIGDLYTAAIEMCAWAEDRCALVAISSEHHRTGVGHLPSPIVLASAMPPDNASTDPARCGARRESSSACLAENLYRAFQHQ
jgi:hypothetical protein